LFAQQVLPSTSQPEERAKNLVASAAAATPAELLDAQLDARLFTPLLQAVRAGDIELYQALLGHKLVCGRLRSQRGIAGSKKQKRRQKKEALAAAAAAAAASDESSAAIGEEASSGSSESGDKSGSDATVATAVASTAAATTATAAATNSTPVLQPDFEGATLESDAREQQSALLVTKALLEGSLQAKLIAVQLLLSTFLSGSSAGEGIEVVCVSEARLPLGAVLGFLFHDAGGSAGNVFAQEELRALQYAPAQQPPAAAPAPATAVAAEGESSSERLRLLQQLRRNQDELQQLITGVQQQQAGPAVPAQSTTDSTTTADATTTAATVAAAAADDETEEQIVADTVVAEDTEAESEGASYASVLLLLKEVFHCGDYVSTPAVAVTAAVSTATVSEVPAGCLGLVSPEAAVLALLAHLDREASTAAATAAVAHTPLTFSLLLALLQTLLKGARSCAALAEQLQEAAADPAAVADTTDATSKGPPGHSEHLVWKRALFYSAAMSCAVRVLTAVLQQHAASKSAAPLGTQQQQQKSAKSARKAQSSATGSATIPPTAATTTSAAVSQQSSLVRRLADCVLEVHSTDWSGAAVAAAATAAQLEPPEQRLQSKCLAFAAVARATAMDAWAAGVPYFYAAHSERVALLLQLMQEVQGSGTAVGAQREQVRYSYHYNTVCNS
jgi:trimeric autotransporter adhesin